MLKFGRLADGPCGRYLSRGPARILIRLLRIGLLSYLGLLLVLYNLQTQLVFPGKATQGRADSAVRPGPGEELVTIQTADGETVKALFGCALDAQGHPLPDSEPRPAVLYFYGNGMCMAHCATEMARLRRLGVHVLIPDYLGYGLSSGQASEAGCYATADACWDYLVHRDDVDPSHVVIAGWSIGGAVAVDLASRRHAAGLIVFSTFTSARDMAARSLPWFPGFLLHHRFESLSKIPQVDCPMLIGHGENDSLVPFEMAGVLAASSKHPVRRFSTRADHNDFFAVEPDRIFSEVDEFLDSALPEGAREVAEPSMAISR